MTKRIFGLLVSTFCIAITSVVAQQHKFNMTSGTLKLIDINEVEVVGYDGNEVVIEVDLDYDEDLAEGLRILSPSGIKDNTGVGLNKSTSGGDVTLSQVTHNFDETFYIKVPNSISIYYEHSTHHGDDILIEDFSGEIEVSANHNDVILENISGPCSVNTMHGEIEARFTSINQDNPISLYSQHDEVHVYVPANAKATFYLKSDYGTMYTDLDLEIDNTESTRMRDLSKKELVGKLNGGGVKFTIEAPYDNIYLRKAN